MADEIWKKPDDVWSKADQLNRDWDRIVGSPNKLPEVQKINPYDESIEAEEDKTSSDDQNLLTAYTLLATWGFDHPIGNMMAFHAERTLPYTSSQMLAALEAMRESSRPEVQELKEVTRGMIAMVYAWAYVSARTGQLVIRDREIYVQIAGLSSTAPGTEDRSRLTASAENMLENTTGLLLTAMDDVKRHGKKNLELFYTGSLQALYAMANLAFGKAAEYDWSIS